MVLSKFDMKPLGGSTEHDEDAEIIFNMMHAHWDYLVAELAKEGIEATGDVQNGPPRHFGFYMPFEDEPTEKGRDDMAQ